MASKHLQKCSILVVEKMKIKVIMRYHWNPSDHKDKERKHLLLKVIQKMGSVICCWEKPIDKDIWEFCLAVNIKITNFKMY